MVIARYITKEIFSTFCAIIFILLFIALSNKFVVFLAKAAAGKLPIKMVFQVIGLYIPEIFGLLAPIALFVAILFTHSRMHADSEFAVLLTSGFDWMGLTKVTMIVAVVISIIVAIINLAFAPMITAQRDKIINEGQAIGVMHAITPGQIQMVDESSDLVFYVEDVADDGTLRNIFIADKGNNVVITAQSAVIQQIKDKRDYYLILKDGHRYIGTPGHGNYAVTHFAEYGRELRFPEAQLPDSDYARPTTDLFTSNSPEDSAELQWRLSMPIVVIILALLAVPIAKVNPRQGRYARFLPAALLYMMYYNALTVVKRWVAAGDVSVFPGLWLVHLVFLLLALAFFYKVSGRWHEYYRSLHS